MRPIMQFLSSRLSDLGLRMWAQRSLGTFAAVLLLLLIVSVAVKVYDWTRKRKEEKDRITITPARFGRAA